MLNQVKQHELELQRNRSYRGSVAIFITRTWPAAVLAFACAATISGCSAQPAAAPEPSSDGPGGSGVVTVEPETGVQTLAAEDVGPETACALVAGSPTLAGLGVSGTPASTQFVASLSLCELRIDGPEHSGSSIGVGVVTAEDVALTAGLDSASIEGTLMLLPSLGENGHFISGAPDVDPAADPRIGSIAAARGDLGVTISWATDEGLIPFSTYEQAVRDLLDAIAE